MSDMIDVVGIMPECVEPVCIPGEPLVWWPDKVIGVGISLGRDSVGQFIGPSRQYRRWSNICIQQRLC